MSVPVETTPGDRITDAHLYGDGYITLGNIMLRGLPDVVHVEGYELVRKSELHISLACTKRLAPLIDPARPVDVERELVEEFKDVATVEPLDDFELLPEFRLVQKGIKKTLIVMAFVPGLELLYDELRDRFQTELPTQPTHITLYTLQPEAGTGILSRQQLSEISHVVDVPELLHLKRVN